MNISERILAIMKEKHMTQKEFSKQSGIPESTVSDWKRKGNQPSSDKLLDICRTLNISIYELFREDFDTENFEPEYFLSKEESFLIEKYRGVNQAQKKRILSYMEQLSNKNEIKKSDEISKQKVAGDTELLQKKNLAYRLRKLARLNRITLDDSVHASGLNRHLFQYLDYLEIDKLEYVKKYLSSIQPFMLTEIKSQEKFENAICVLDGYYRISIYIKVDATRGEEVVVSFHENNKNGIARTNIISRNEYVYVFADSIGSHVEGTDDYSINVFINRGVRTFPINVPAMRYDEDGFLVRYQYINNAMIEIVNRYLEELYSSDLDFGEVTPFSSIQQLSFSAYGHDVFSNISLLVDSILIQRDALGKQTSDAALMIYCNSLELLESDKRQLLLTLKERFSVQSSRMLPNILERIELNL